MSRIYNAIGKQLIAVMRNSAVDHDQALFVHDPLA